MFELPHIARTNVLAVITSVTFILFLGPLLTKSFSEVDYSNVIPLINAVARKHRMGMPKEFVLIIKQLLYFDRYAKLLAPNLNIFTDPRLVMSMMTDIVKVRQEQNQSTAPSAP